MENASRTSRSEPMLILAMTAMLVCFSANADSFYVWSNNDGTNGTIRKFDASGAALPFIINLSGWNGPIGLALDNAGNLYTGDPGDSSIRKFFPNRSGGSSVGGGDSISALAFDHSGFLYATAPNWNTLLRPLWDSYGWDGWGTASNYTYLNLSSPINLAVDGTGNICVADCWILNPWDHRTYTNSIQKFSADLVFLGTVATNLNSPWGLAFDPASNLYVANSGTNGHLSNTILKFAPDGASSIFATASDGLNSPRGLAFDSATNLYVANAGNGTIQKFTPDGIGSIFVSGLNSPTSLAVFPGLNVWSATPITLHPMFTTNGTAGLVFRSTPGLSFTVLSATNLLSPNWLSAGLATEVSAGIYEFTDSRMKNASEVYYRVLAQ